MRPKLTNLFPF